MEIATAHFALTSRSRAGAKRGQAALNFWFFWFKPKERKKYCITVPAYAGMTQIGEASNIIFNRKALKYAKDTKRN